MEEARKRILYWNGVYEYLNDNPYTKNIDGIEIHATARFSELLSRARRETFCLIAIHHNSENTAYFAREIRKTKPQIPILALTGAIEDTPYERTLWKEGLNEEFGDGLFDDVISKAGSLDADVYSIVYWLKRMTQGNLR